MKQHNKLSWAINNQIENTLRYELSHYVNRRSTCKLYDELWEQLREPLENQLWEQFGINIGNKLAYETAR